MADTPALTDQHLYPLTLAFQKGLTDGTVTLDNAWEFCERVYSAYLESCVRARDTPQHRQHLKYTYSGERP